MNKPAFNPNQPYEAVNAQSANMQTVKPKFNPFKPFEPAGDQYQLESTENLGEAGRFLKSIASGFGRGATGGLLDEALATASVQESPLQTLSKSIGSLFGGEGSKFQEQYNQALPQVRQSQEALQQEFPIASTVSDIAGAIAQPVKGFKGMVAQGALQGFGRGEGGLENRIDSAGLGGSLGALGYGLGKVSKAGLSKVFGKEAAGEMAMKQAAPRFTDIRHIEERGLSLADIGDELLKQKALSSTPENSLNKIQEALKKQNISKKLDDLYTKNNVVVEGDRVLSEIEDIILDTMEKHPERYANASNEYLNFVAPKLKNNIVTPLEMKNIIRNLDKQINYNKRAAEQTGGALSGTEFLNDLRRVMEGGLRTQVAEQATPKVRDAYLKANKTYELLSAAEDIFEYQALKEKAGSFFPSGSPLTKLYEAAVYPINTLAPTAAYPMKGARNILEKFPGQQGLNLLGELPTRGQKLQILGDQLMGGQSNGM
jgi:DNA-binding transcriptional MerR regulator